MTNTLESLKKRAKSVGLKTDETTDGNMVMVTDGPVEDSNFHSTFVEDWCADKDSEILLSAKQSYTGLQAIQDLIAAAEKRLLPPRPWVVTLCGSTRFLDAFFAEGWRLALEGKMVYSIGVVKHSAADEDGAHGAEMLGPEVVESLDELHKRKIDDSDEAKILNVDGYIGESTQAELDYARSQGKVVTFLEDWGPTGKRPEEEK